MTERTDSVWKGSALAAVYLQGVRAAIPFAQEQIETMLRLIQANERPVTRLLDLGCGDGVLAGAILQQYPSAEAVLVDFSGAMLEAAKKRFAESPGRVTLINADYGEPSWTAAVQSATARQDAAAQQPHVSDAMEHRQMFHRESYGLYDTIVSGFSIHHQPDERKREVYREIFDLLAPGGIFVHLEHVASASAWVASVNDEEFIESLHRHHANKTRAEVAELYYHRPDKSANLLAPVEKQCDWLREIGFEDVDCYFKVFELAVFGGRRRAG